MIHCDTNILIEFYRGNSEIIQELQVLGVANLSVSVVTSHELYYGARDKRELAVMRKHLS
jgi:predicted nucleic acid-binding protein